MKKLLAFSLLFSTAFCCADSPKKPESKSLISPELVTVYNEGANYLLIKPPSELLVTPKLTDLYKEAAKIIKKDSPGDFWPAGHIWWCDEDGETIATETFYTEGLRTLTYEVGKGEFNDPVYETIALQAPGLIAQDCKKDIDAGQPRFIRNKHQAFCSIGKGFVNKWNEFCYKKMLQKIEEQSDRYRTMGPIDTEKTNLIDALEVYRQEYYKEN